MKKTLSDFLCVSVFASTLGASGAMAQSGSANSGDSDFSLEDSFHGGKHEVTIGGGVLFSPFIASKARPTVDYAFGDAGVGFMVSDTAGSGLLRGNVELVPEYFGAGIYESTGSYITGGTLWFRYNFIQPQSRLVPYFQVGGGWTFMDIDHRYDGQNFNFNVGASAGLRYFFKPKVALEFEYRFQHISNANLGHHNIGLNAEGPVMGITWMF